MRLEKRNLITMLIIQKSLLSYKNLISLKKVILDKDRLELFKFTKKQSIVVNRECEEVNLGKSRVVAADANDEKKDEEGQEAVDYQQLFNKYRVIKQENKMEFDQRLVEDFDNDIKLPFDMILEKF